MLKTRLLRIEAPHFVAGVVFTRDPHDGWVVSEAAPICAWMIGKSNREIWQWLTGKGHRWQWLSDCNQCLSCFIPMARHKQFCGDGDPATMTLEDEEYEERINCDEGERCYICKRHFEDCRCPAEPTGDPAHDAMLEEGDSHDGG